MSVPPIPAAALEAANTTYITRSVLKYTPAATPATPYIFLVDLVDYDGTAEISALPFPGVDGKLRPIRRDQVDSNESVALKCYNIFKVIEALGGSLNGLSDGTSEIWLRDPKDNSGKVKAYVAPFPCSAQRDGQVKFGDKTYSFATLKFTNTGASDLHWEFNADVTAGTTIATQPPASLSVNEGAPLTLTVTTSGSAPTGYQWKKNGVAIAGATAAAYTVAEAAETDAGGYVCEVASASGTLVTTPCVVQVVPA
ncbi:hypothetical protein OH491_13530 [Termitidicoccus mucosus]|uniref:Ig-like domain-containing protein n=1 Tax=Termitidicoccus mucosus TaxID=1184151 RepID=A0A178IH72_9BACT|nr:hypothetical protein AW736_13915 [Opitutaceae bacterium TSB47]